MKTVTCIDKDNHLHEVPASRLIWRPSAYGIILKDNHILLSPQYDWYDLPGGGVELWETIAEWLIREVKEETGMDVTVWELVDYKTNFFKPTSKEERYYESICFYHICSIIGWELSVEWFAQDEKEYARLAEWVPISELVNIKFYSSIDVLSILKKIL